MAGDIAGFAGKLSATAIGSTVAMVIVVRRPVQHTVMLLSWVKSTLGSGRHHCSCWLYYVRTGLACPTWLRLVLRPWRALPVRRVERNRCGNVYVNG